jgi:hypothetical protein
MDDDPPPGVEYLDEWDSPQAPRPPRGGRGRILVLAAVVLVVAVVIAVALGATQRRAVGPVTSTSPTPSPTEATSTGVPTASATDLRSTYQVTAEVPTAYMTMLVDPPQPYTPVPVESDVEADPLTIKLLEKAPKSADMSIGYRVSVCVNSASAGGGKVRISRDSWFLGFASTGSSGPARDRALVTPAFPVEGLYGKGQCATGYVTFAKGEESPSSISYSDGRFGWTWVF